MSRYEAVSKIDFVSYRQETSNNNFDELGVR